MKIITVELGEESAQMVLGVLQKERSALAQKLTQIDDQITRIQSSISSDGDASSNIASQKTTAPSHSSKRARKGQAEKVIIGFLTSLIGNGESTKEIAAMTGVNYFTAHRVLKRMKEAGKVILKNERWTLLSNLRQ